MSALVAEASRRGILKNWWHHTFSRMSSTRSFSRGTTPLGGSPFSSWWTIFPYLAVDDVISSGSSSSNGFCSRSIQNLLTGGTCFRWWYVERKKVGKISSNFFATLVKTLYKMYGMKV